MKKITLCLMLLLVLMVVPTIIFAAEGNVAKIGETEYATLSEAVEKGGTIILINDVVLDKVIDVDKNVVLDLNGYSIKPADVYTNDSLIIVLHGGTLTIQDSSSEKAGIITSNNKSNVYAAIKMTKKGYNTENKATLIVNSGTLEGYYYGICGSGNPDRINTDITINGGTVKGTAPTGLGIFHPQIGTLTVNGGTVEGTKTGIEMRAGKLEVKGGTIIGNGDEITVVPNGSGSTTCGAGIAIAQHTTSLDTSVVIKGGTIKGYTALYQSNPQKNDDDAISKVSITVTGGVFETINNGTEVVYSENKDNFITGGTFSSDVINYAVSGYACEKVNDMYKVGIKYPVNTNAEYGEVKVDKNFVFAGETVTITAIPNELYEVGSIIVKDINEKEVTITNNTFVMPESQVTVYAVFNKKPVELTQEVDVPSEVEETEELETNLLDSLAEAAKENSVLAQLLKNNNVEVKVEFNEIDEKEVEDIEKEKIEEAANKEVKGIKIAKYIDITIVVKNKDENGNVIDNLEELNEEITFTVAVPTDLPEVEEGYTRTYYIIRNHNGEIEIIENAKLSEDGKSIIFASNKFSTYAIAYKDVENSAGSELIPEEPKTEEPKTEDIQTENTTTNSASMGPVTGDDIAIYVVSLLISLMGIIIVGKLNTSKSRH